MTDESHGQAQRYCNVLKDSETGARCRNSAGKGTSHPGFGACKWHGGTSHNLVVAAARQEVASLATDIEVDGETVLLSAIGRAWGAVYFCAERIEAIQAEADAISEETDPDAMSRRVALSKMFVTYNKMYGEWLDRSVHYASVAKTAGIEERRIKLEEDRAKLVVDIMRGVLKDLGIRLDSPEVKEAFRRNFSLIQGAA